MGYIVRKVKLLRADRLLANHNWRLDKRTIQHRVKAVRSQFYRMRALMEARRCKVMLTPDPTGALRRVVEDMDKADLRVNVLVGGTLPKVGA